MIQTSSALDIMGQNERELLPLWPTRPTGWLLARGWIDRPDVTCPAQDEERVETSNCEAQPPWQDRFGEIVKALAQHSADNRGFPLPISSCGLRLKIRPSSNGAHRSVLC